MCGGIGTFCERVTTSCQPGRRDILRNMTTKHYSVILIFVGVAAWFQGLPPSARAEGDDWIGEYTRTSIAETIERDTDGNITGRTVVTDTRVAVRQKITEVRKADTNGVEHLVSRKTDTYDSFDPRALPVEIVIEKQSDTEDKSLVITSVTTVVMAGFDKITTYETRDPGRNTLVISKRVTSGINKLGQKVITIETPDEYGNLVVTKTTTYSTE